MTKQQKVCKNNCEKKCYQVFFFWLVKCSWLYWRTKCWHFLDSCLSFLWSEFQRFYIPTSRQLKRIESTTRSPIYTNFSETITGASTIRAYGAQANFISKSDYLVDHNLVYYFASIASNRYSVFMITKYEKCAYCSSMLCIYIWQIDYFLHRWLGFRLEFLASIVVLSAALFAVIGKDSLSGGLVGLSISYALQV